MKQKLPTINREYTNGQLLHEYSFYIGSYDVVYFTCAKKLNATLLAGLIYRKEQTECS